MKIISKHLPFKLSYFISFFLIINLSCKKLETKTYNSANIIIIMTDDQGYGDIAAHGNPWIQTPELDKLYSESLRLTDFHVGTTCTPTRAGLLTGRNCNEVGAWHTVGGRSLLNLEETTLAEVLKENGYKTAMFGKWHLGDNSPYLPNNRGFDETLIHGGGGVGQTPDYWDNDYYDDTYFRNGIPEKFEGYATDIWFNEAISFIKKEKNKPFFCYISTNAQHSTFHVPDKYSELYKNIDGVPEPNFYGMITNIDENIGRLRKILEKNGLSKNTILIFLTDNGTSGGAVLDENGFLIKGFNAGMRGKKVSPYEGGHRVPFYIHWPNGSLAHGQDVDALTSYTDIMPTILDLTNIKYESKLPFEGESIKALFMNPNTKWKSRTIITDTQRGPFLVRGKMSSVMTEDFRLINGNELYDHKNDPGQKINIAEDFPEIVKELNYNYSKWWDRISKNKDFFNPIPVGKNSDEVTLTSHDIHIKKDIYPAWHQEQVRLDKNPIGFWHIDVINSGKYKLSIHRYPKETQLNFNDIMPKGGYIEGGESFSEGIPVDVKKITISVDERQKVINGSRDKYNVVLNLSKGTKNLSVRITDRKDKEREAYFVYLKKL